MRPEADENQLISLAVDAAKKMLSEPNPPKSIVLHYLKLATTRERMEQEIMEKQKELMDAKKQALESQAKVEQLYADAMRAMQKYSGYGDDESNNESY